jgi:hypothetical protein
LIRDGNSKEQSEARIRLFARHQSVQQSLTWRYRMGNSSSDLNQLTARKGDSRAAAELLQRLQPQVTRMIRRVMRSGATHSPFAQRVVAEVDRLKPTLPNHSPVGQEYLIGQISHRICRHAIENVQAGHASAGGFLDTVIGL